MHGSLERRFDWKKVMEIFVGNLPFSETEESIKELFGQYGQVDRVKLLTDYDTGRSRGTAFVTMEDFKAAQTAISELDGKELEGRPLRVNQARERSERGPGGGGGGGGGGGFRGGQGGGGGGGFRGPRGGGGGGGGGFRGGRGGDRGDRGGNRW
jgi:RNA recognition motif-containing protein